MSLGGGLGNEFRDGSLEWEYKCLDLCVKYGYLPRNYGYRTTLDILSKLDFGAKVPNF
jgi:hypothetical protein